MRLALGVVGLGVEADAGARAHAPTAAHPLAGRGLGDLLHAQGLDAALGRVALDAREARIDDHADAGDGHGGLSDVGGQDNPPQGGALEDARLLAGRKAREEGEDLGARQVAAVEEGLGLADFALAGEEDEDVAGVLAHGVDGVGDVAGEVVGVDAVGVLVLLGEHVAQPDGLDGVEAPGDGDDRGVVEEGGEALGVEGGRGDDDQQVLTAGENALEQAEEEVDVQAALVRFVDDESAVAAQEGVGLHLGEEHAIGHQLDLRIRREAALEAVLVAHGLTQGGAHLVGQAPGHRHRRQAPRLRDAHQPARRRPRQQRQLGQLRGLARARVAADDDHALAGHHREQLLAVGRNRERLGQVQPQTHREPCAPRCTTVTAQKKVKTPAMA